MPPEKTCKKCGETHPATTEYFYRHKSNRDGLHGSCITCQKRRSRELRTDPVRREQHRAACALYKKRKQADKWARIKQMIEAVNDRP
jgi:hypothetical protein